MKLNINIPSTLNEITLRQYKTFLNIQATIKDEKFLSVKLIEIFCKIKPSDVMLLKVKDSEMISNSINKLFDDKPALVTRFKINNKEYGFHPQLDELTLGEYVDLDTYIGDWENMEKAMSVLYRPIIAKLKGKYTISEFRSGLVENYNGLFGGGGDRSLDAGSNFNRKYGWFQSIFSVLAQSDIRRLEDITKLNIHQCLYTLEYVKEKNELEAKQIKKKFK